jgi:hypothetical protein
LFVHIGGPSSNQATTLESQMIHMVQELFGQTLRASFARLDPASGRGEASPVERPIQLHPALAPPCAGPLRALDY